MKVILPILALCISTSVAEQINIIPKPLELAQQKDQTFTIGQTLTVKASDSLIGSLKIALPHFKFVKVDANAQLKIEHDPSIKNKEGYQLKVSPSGISIKAQSQAGAFYAAQTLRQLMPSSVFKKDSTFSKLEIPCVTINDAPRFGWRGLMLDSSRHFQTIEEIERFIDNMAVHKLNVFHWHLTDGHGWRFESKKYPKLTEVGAWRTQPGYPKKGETNQYGGFYTQKQMKAVVAYAKARGITVVPEVDMPGHCFAFVSAYPEIGCLEKPQGLDFLYTYPADAQRFPGKFGTDVLCVGKQKTVKMCTEILDELMDIFPSEFIHIGGDEVNKGNWKSCKHCQDHKQKEGLKDEHELQSWFIQQLDNHISSKGRRLVGWDEILEGGLAKNATVMSWQGEQGGIKAAKMGHDVVMSPQTYIYFDHGQSHSPQEPAHWPGHKPLKRVYSYDPTPQSLSAAEKKHILGVQGNVWTIFIHEEWLLDLCTWPRAAALAEVAWSSTENKNWDDFYQRLSTTHRERLDNMGINYWWEDNVELGSWEPKDLKNNNETVTLTFDVTDTIKAGDFNINFNYTKGAHALVIREVTLLENGKMVSKDDHEGATGSQNKQNGYSLPLNKKESSAKYTIKALVHGSEGSDSFGTLNINNVETKVLKKLPYEADYKASE